MIFVMDESGSIGPENFEKMKQLAIDITDHFMIGPDQTQVGWISFDDTARVVFNLNAHTTKTSLHAGIDVVQYLAGDTSIAAGLHTLLYDGFVESAGYRPSFDVPEVAIVVTNGRSNRNESYTPVIAERLREERNIDMFVVGVTDAVNDAELETVASAGIAVDISRNIFHITGFNDEELNALAEVLRAQTCFGKLLKQCPYTIFIILTLILRCEVYRT